MSWSPEVYQLLAEERIRDRLREALRIGIAAQAVPRRVLISEALAQALSRVLGRAFPGRRRDAFPPECRSAVRSLPIKGDL
jgi:hypothetical protein